MRAAVDWRRAEIVVGSGVAGAFAVVLVGAVPRPGLEACTDRCANVDCGGGAGLLVDAGEGRPKDPVPVRLEAIGADG